MKNEKKIVFDRSFTFIEKDNECKVFAKKKGEEEERCECGLITWACKYPACKKGK